MKKSARWRQKSSKPASPRAGRRQRARRLRWSKAGSTPPATRPESRTRHGLLPWLASGLAVVAIAGAAAWYFVPPAVVVASPIRGPAVEAVYATGSVEAPVTIAIAGRLPGRIAEVLVNEGDEVAKGDVLLRFEDAEVRETLRQLSAQEVLAQKDYERVDKLLASGAATQSAHDKAYATWQAAKAATAGATVNAGYLTLTAPTAGQIVKRDVEVGQLVPANQAVLWLARDDPLRISSSVDEEDVARVVVGQKVLIRADAFGDRIFNGEVQAITPMGDTVARNYRVRIALAGETPLRIGMTVETNIVVRREDKALLVPTSAIDKDRVWTVVDGKLAQQTVTVGVKGADRTEIVAGLSDGDLVVVTPEAGFEPGDRVRATKAAAQ